MKLWILIREVNPLPDAPSFGHTCDRTLLFQVYYRELNALHGDIGDLQPIRLPTIRSSNCSRSGYWLHPERMKSNYLVAGLQVLLLAFSGPPASPLTAAPQPVQAQAALAAGNGWRWPLAGEPEILEPFDKPEENWLPGHRGVDLAASSGDSVFAPQRGQVAFASVIVDRPVLVIDHGSGFKTSIEPVAAGVSVGDWVEAGAKVGQVATGAHCSGRCIHWGVRLEGEYIDPVLLIRDMRPSILLPLHE